MKQMHWSINQKVMKARMTGVVVTLLCRQITSELWHHCAALSLSPSFLSPFPVVYLVFCCSFCSRRHHSIPNLVWNKNAWGNEREKKRERAEVHEGKKISGWRKGRSRREKLGGDKDEGSKLKKRGIQRWTKERRDRETGSKAERNKGRAGWESERERELHTLAFSFYSP